MEVIKVGNLLTLPLEFDWRTVTGTFNVLFEDGVVVKFNNIELQISVLIWRKIKKHMPLDSRLSINKYYVEGFFSEKALEELIRITWIQVANEFEPDFRVRQSAFFRDVMDLYNEIYNLVFNDFRRFATSLDLEDLVEIQFDDKIIQSIVDLEANVTTEMFKKSEVALDEVMRMEKHRGNTLARGYLSKIYNRAQVKQLIGPRWELTDLDGTIFKIKATRSLLLGLGGIAVYIAATGPARKALAASNLAIATIEFFGRETQLVGNIVKEVSYSDCGSKRYLDWFVKPPSEGYTGDLVRLVSKWRLDPETGKEVEVLPSDTHLNGTTIQLRTAIYCEEKDKYKVCAKCLGRLAINLQAHSSAGLIATARNSSSNGQAALKIKHIADAATVHKIALNEFTKKFFISGKNGLIFKNEIFKEDVKSFHIIISEYESRQLRDLTPENLRKVEISRVTALTKITIDVVYKNSEKIKYTISLKDGKRRGILTSKFVAYLLETGIKLETNGDIRCDMAKWKAKSAFLTLPDIEFDFLAANNKLKAMFTKIPRLKDGTSKESPVSLLTGIFDTMNSKHTIHLAIHEIIVYAFMVKDLSDYNYDLSRGVSNPQVGSLNDIMGSRSLGSALGFRDSAKRLLTPWSFRENVPDSPFDILLKPNEVISNL